MRKNKEHLESPWTQRTLFFHSKRKGKGRKRKAPTPGPAAHICSPWRTGAQPLLWAEGRPGGPAPVAGSSRPPCTPPGRQTARAGCAAAAPLTAPSWAPSTRSHPRASTSVGTGDTRARSEAACVTGGLTGRASGLTPQTAPAVGWKDPQRTLRGLGQPHPTRPPSSPVPAAPAGPPVPADVGTATGSRAVRQPHGCFSPHHSPILCPSPADNSLGCLPPSLLSPPRRGVCPRPCCPPRGGVSLRVPKVSQRPDRRLLNKWMLVPTSGPLHSCACSYCPNCSSPNPASPPPCVCPRTPWQAAFLPTRGRHQPSQPRPRLHGARVCLLFSDWPRAQWVAQQMLGARRQGTLFTAQSRSWSQSEPRGWGWGLRRGRTPLWTLWERGRRNKGLWASLTFEMLQYQKVKGM